jgi:hypothetical protein
MVTIADATYHINPSGPNAPGQIITNGPKGWGTGAENSAFTVWQVRTSGFGQRNDAAA